MNVNSFASFRVTDGISPSELMGFCHVHTQGDQRLIQAMPVSLWPCQNSPQMVCLDLGVQTLWALLFCIFNSFPFGTQSDFKTLLLWLFLVFRSGTEEFS